MVEAALSLYEREEGLMPNKVSYTAKNVTNREVDSTHHFSRCYASFLSSNLLNFPKKIASILKIGSSQGESQIAWKNNHVVVQGPSKF